MVNIVLVEPEIPQNAGNIVRTCSAINAKLYMVKPLSFIMDDKHFKRAGMDYLDFANVSVVDSFQEILDANPNAEFFYASTKSQKVYSEVDYSDMDEVFLLFGKETKGLPEDILLKYIDKAIRIKTDGFKYSIYNYNYQNNCYYLYTKHQFVNYFLINLS